MEAKAILFNIVEETGNSNCFVFKSSRVDANFWRTKEELKNECYGYSGCIGLTFNKQGLPEVKTKPMKESELVYVITCQVLNEPKSLLDVKYNVTKGPRDNFITPLSYTPEVKTVRYVKIATETTMELYKTVKLENPNLILSNFVNVCGLSTTKVYNGEPYNQDYYVDTVFEKIHSSVYNVEFQMFVCDIQNNVDYITNIIQSLCECNLKSPSVI